MGEEAALRDAAARFFRAARPGRAAAPWPPRQGAFDRATYTRLGAELGVLGLAVPEPQGGGGGSLADCSVVLEEAGRGLYDGPFLTAGVVAPMLLAQCSDGVPQSLLQDVCAGRTIAVLAAPMAAAGAADMPEDGRFGLVLDAPRADVLIIAQPAGSAVELRLLDMSTSTAVRPVPVLDAGMSVGDVAVSVGAGTAIGEVTVDVLDSVLLLGAAGSAAQQLGLAARCLEVAVAHARDRYAFGQPIGSFQAVQRHLVDGLVAVESARAAVEQAFTALDGGDCTESVIAVSVAKSTCDEAALQLGAANLQVHGGIGYTWEHEASALLKRARACSGSFGDRRRHRLRLAAALGV